MDCTVTSSNIPSPKMLILHITRMLQRCTGVSISIPGDSTADLDYTSPLALELDGTAAVLRSSTTPTQDVSLILPNNGQLDSLGTSGDIWIEASDWTL